MSILTQIMSVFQKELSKSDLPNAVTKLISIIYQNPCVGNYTGLVEKTGRLANCQCIEQIRIVLERMDLEYRNTPERLQFYYVKQTRERTLITLFGLLTYKRTEYIDRSTKKPFCYVDWKMGLRKKERYDPCIQTMLIEGYANNNSMIKVGENVGAQIGESFNTNPNRYSPIPRQTVQKIILRNKVTKPKFERVSHTPNILYIMSDEMFVAQQDKRRPANMPKQKSKKIMVKLAVVFEGIENIIRKDGRPSSRNKLINTAYIANCNEFFWDEVIEALHQKYDMEKVKTIYLMGDGAIWIKSGVNDLKSSALEVQFGNDRFHFHKAIERIADDQSYYKILKNYCYNNAKNDFKALVNTLKETCPERLDSIIQHEKYILNHWDSFQITIQRIKIGCPMEQAVSHVLASVFTNVAKAYSKDNFHVYLHNRMLHQNKCDTRNLVLESITKDSKAFNDEFDFSVFEKKIYPQNRYSTFFDKKGNTRF